MLVKSLMFEKNHKSHFTKTEFSITILSRNICFEYACDFLTSSVWQSTSNKDRFKKIKKIGRFSFQLIFWHLFQWNQKLETQNIRYSISLQGFECFLNVCLLIPYIEWCIVPSWTWHLMSYTIRNQKICILRCNSRRWVNEIWMCFRNQITLGTPLQISKIYNFPPIHTLRNIFKSNIISMSKTCL